MDGSTTGSLPATISVQFSNGADPAAMKAMLDGVDITSQFSAADSGGVRQVQVDRPAVNLGKNQIEVLSGSLMASASFFVSLNGSEPGTGQNLPLLIPIKTRYVTGDGSEATDYNIALYEDPNNPTTPTLIQAKKPPDGSNTGFQIVYLRRSDLTVVSNISTSNPDYGEQYFKSPLFYTLLDVPSACGSGGCLVIVQSLETLGYTPCYHPGNGGDFEACAGTAVLFEAMGGSARWLYANGTNDKIAYSFIGNTDGNGSPVSGPVTAGIYYERLTCSATSSCDSLGSPNTNGTAPSDASPSQIGNLSGVLLRDNYNNYTFAQNAPIIAFSSGVDTQNVSHRFTINGVDYWSGFAGKGGGGFHIVILDGTTLALKQNQWVRAMPDASELDYVSKLINQYNSYNDLIFLAAFGDTTYTPNTANVARWYSLAHNLIPALGGTEQVFYLMNNQEHAPPKQIDDYTLIGGFVDSKNLYAWTGLQGETGAEMSSVIARETEKTPLSSELQGFLELGHEGYYRAKQYGHAVGLNHDVQLATGTNAELLSASRLDPIPWPFPGPDQAKSQAAYNWISSQLCCDDIRSAYVNLNVDASIWLAQLQPLTFDQAKIPNSDQADFDAMKQQLTTEFQYVELVRLFQRNLLGLYQNQQANLSLLLQQATDEVIDNLQVQLTQPVRRQSWTTTLETIFGVESALVGFIPEASTVTAGLQTALAIGTGSLWETSAYTNSASGVALRAQENAEVEAGDLAGNTADEFAANLITVGNEFDRIVTDWGRLKTLGGPLLADQVPWDGNVSGTLLEGYDRLIRRDLYTKLLQANAQVIYYPYIQDDSFIGNTFWGSGYLCSWDDENIDPYWQLANAPLLFYPSGALNTDNEDSNCCGYPHGYDWAVWALVYSQNNGASCAIQTTQPSTFGLFKPLDPDDPNALGAYRLWFFTRQGYKVNTNTEQTPCYDDSC